MVIQDILKLTKQFGLEDIKTLGDFISNPTRDNIKKLTEKYSLIVPLERLQKIMAYSMDASLDLTGVDIKAILKFLPQDKKLKVYKAIEEEMIEAYMVKQNE